MMQHEFFTLPEAAAFLSVPKHAVRRLVVTEALPICFDFDGQLSGVEVVHQDNRQENAGISMTGFRGVLRALSPSISSESITATLVEIVSEDGGKRINRQNGILLPTEHPHGGRIVGARVTGFVDFVEVHKGAWLFDIHDLCLLDACTAPKGDAGDTASVKNIRSRSDAMTIEISSIISEMEKRREFPATPTVMAKLKELAGRSGSCVVDVAVDGDGVIWQRVNGHSETLTSPALEKRLARMKGRQ